MARARSDKSSSKLFWSILLLATACNYGEVHRNTYMPLVHAHTQYIHLLNKSKEHRKIPDPTRIIGWTGLHGYARLILVPNPLLQIGDSLDLLQPKFYPFKLDMSTIENKQDGLAQENFVRHVFQVEQEGDVKVLLVSGVKRWAVCDLGRWVQDWRMIPISSLFILPTTLLKTHLLAFNSSFWLLL